MKIKENYRVMAFLIMPFFFILLAFLAGRTITPGVSMRGLEERAIKYHTEVEEIPSVKKYVLTRAIKDPFEYVFLKIARPSEGLKNRGLKKSKKEKVIKLTLTIIGKKKRFAILNGKTVTEGSLFRGYMVEQILQNKVILSKNGIRRTIFLEE
jgi:hypothetical protein